VRRMGLRDFFKPRSLSPPKIDDLYKLSPAAVTMGQLKVEPTGKAGMCFRSIGDGDVRGDESRHPKGAGKQRFPGQLHRYHGPLWLHVGDHRQRYAGGRLSNVYVASQILIEGSFSDHVTAAIFRFEQGESPVYWVYNYRRAAFYPFAPRGNERDMQLEYRLRLLVMGEMPVDSLDYWFPIWGIPF